MKRLFLFVVCLMPLLLSAQIKLLNTDLIYPDSNYLYVGEENHLKTVGFTLQNAKVTSTNSTITIHNNQIVTIPKKKGVDTIRIFQNNKIVSTNIFTVLEFFGLDGHQTQFAKTTDRVLSIKKILLYPYISIAVPTCYYKIRSDVVSFQCFVIQKDFETLSFDINGNRLSESALSAIKKLKEGDVIEFKNVLYGFTVPRACPRLLTEFTIQIE